jgi:hypothetical protein
LLAFIAGKGKLAYPAVQKSVHGNTKQNGFVSKGNENTCGFLRWGRRISVEHPLRTFTPPYAADAPFRFFFFAGLLRGHLFARTNDGRYGSVALD